MAGPGIRGLYVITPDWRDTVKLLVAARAAIEGGAKVLQYRNKVASAGQRLEHALGLSAVCAKFGALFIVNDHLDLALEVEADGVHLGGTDGDIGAARALLGPDAIIGASCYDQLANAERAVAEGASYVAFGAFFPTTTKVTSSRATPDLLRQSAALGVPRVAIGGLSPDNVGPIIAAGADLVAVVSGIFAAPDPVATQRAFLAQFP